MLKSFDFSVNMIWLAVSLHSMLHDLCFFFSLHGCSYLTVVRFQKFAAHSRHHEITYDTTLFRTTPS